MATKFEENCQLAAEAAGINVYFTDDNRKKDAFEDDGCLHVVSGRGQRAMFGLNQDDAVWSNEKTNIVLNHLKLGHFLGERTLVEIDEDEDECCPHCGHAM